MEMETQRPDTYWGELRRIAIDLKGKRGSARGFWKSFKGDEGTAALMGWLYYRGQCVYCERCLVQKGQMIGGAGTTDHLIPRAKSKIGFTSHFNAVPSCASCNSIKGLLDRKLEPSDYPDVLDWNAHIKLLSQARKFIAEKRTAAEATFESDKSQWDTALNRRNALDNSD
jgi:5-methylcytosine-specific restriction endonuclease McrA